MAGRGGVRRGTDTLAGMRGGDRPAYDCNWSWVRREKASKAQARVQVFGLSDTARAREAVPGAADGTPIPEGNGEGRGGDDGYMFQADVMRPPGHGRRPMPSKARGAGPTEY